jgi:hypothetical protein
VGGGIVHPALHVVVQPVLQLELVRLRDKQGCMFRKITFPGRGLSAFVSGGDI